MLFPYIAFFSLVVVTIMFICYLLPRPDPGLSNVLGAVDCLPSVGRSIRNARFSYTGRPGRAGTTEKRVSLSICPTISLCECVFMYT